MCCRCLLLYTSQFLGQRRYTGEFCYPNWEDCTDIFWPLHWECALEMGCLAHRTSTSDPYKGVRGDGSARRQFRSGPFCGHHSRCTGVILSFLTERDVAWGGSSVLGHKGGKRAGASFLGGGAEGAGAAQPGEEDTQGDLPGVVRPAGGCEDRAARLCSGRGATGTNHTTQDST